MKKVLGLIFITFTFYHISIGQNNTFNVQAAVNNGLIEGTYDTKTGIQKYFGIPFAKPPIGDLRWKAPQPMTNWTGVKQTKKFSPRPMQKIVFGDMNSRSDGLSEDCLYLNVWTPAKRNTKNLPVLLYYYGGGNAAGDASEPRYDGEEMARKGMVVVTTNYRLNIFGYLAHPELTSEAPYKASGNYGQLDQAFALKWVYDNIATFGGDPSKITICGESAGSIAVSTQMASPLSKKYLAGVIGESGASINPTMAPVPLKEAEKMGTDFLTKHQIKDIKSFRALSSRDVYEIWDESKMFGMPIVIDNYFLPKTLPEIFKAKEQAQIPILIGWNSAEIPGQAFMAGQAYTKDNFIAQVNKELPSISADVLKEYPHNDATEVELSATAMASDRFISYSTWKWFELHSNNSPKPVYRYLYSKIRPDLINKNLAPGLAGGTVTSTAPRPKPVGAPHACEIEYCMGNLALIKEFDWTPDDYKVSKTMSDYFANFVKTGNPNGDKLPTWPAAGAKDDQPAVMVIDTESKAIQSTIEARYKLLDKVYKN